jgi:hypothetical protein
MAGLDSFESIVGIEKAAQHGKAEDAHHCISIAAWLVYTDYEIGCNSWVGRGPLCSSSGSCMITVHILQTGVREIEDH